MATSVRPVAPAATPPAAVPPADPRSRVVILLIACTRLIKAVALIALGVFEVRILDSPGAREHLLDLVDRLGVDPRQPRIDHLIHVLLGIGTTHLRAYEIATFLYAAMFLVEAVGLFLDKRWAEWLVVATTALLIPLEVWHLVDERRWHQFWLVGLNVVVAVFLFRHVRHRLRRSLGDALPRQATEV